MSLHPVLLATRSTGKLRELRALFADAGLAVVDLTSAGVPEDPVAEEAIEAFDTFGENAMAKARHFHERTGLPTVADDSGLAVDALGGAPGVRSKRWSAASGLEGEALVRANNRRLVAELAGAADRRARFVCAAAWCDGTHELVALGEVPGEIVLEARGADGFGYDPHFVPEGGRGRTFAELSPAEKQGLSHRGRAFAALLRRLAELGVGA